jgi:hypothetical protein
MMKWPWPIRFEHRIPLAGKMRFDSVLFRERGGQGKGRIRARKSGNLDNAIVELLPPGRRERLASLIFPTTGTASSNGVPREWATATSPIHDQSG